MLNKPKNEKQGVKYPLFFYDFYKISSAHLTTFISKPTSY